MIEAVRREAIYLWYYFDVQIRQIFWYWVFGILIGSAVSVFAKNKIHQSVEAFGKKMPGIVSLIFASILGIASPLCMYGTIPISASFSQKGLKDDFLAAFMMSSILLNPQLIIFSSSLGFKVLTIRITSCFLCGVVAGLLVRLFYKSRPYFDFTGFESSHNHDTDKNIFLRYIKNVGRNIKATCLWFLLGIVFSSLFQRYIPQNLIVRFFGKNEGFGVLLAATIGVPLYVCGGGTIPLLINWLNEGMSVGAAAAFMITGPATKITNLGALKIVLGVKNFFIYMAFVIIFSISIGALINLLM